MQSVVRNVLRRPITDRSAWKGSGLAAAQDWIHTLAPPAIAEIDDTLARLRASPVALTEIRREHFPLPAVARASPDTRERLLAAGSEPVSMTNDEFGAFARAETAKWAKVVRAAGIKAE